MNYQQDQSFWEPRHFQEAEKVNEDGGGGGDDGVFDELVDQVLDATTQSNKHNTASASSIPTMESDSSIFINNNNISNHMINNQVMQPPVAVQVPMLMQQEAPSATPCCFPSQQLANDTPQSSFPLETMMAPTTATSALPVDTIPILSSPLIDNLCSSDTPTRAFWEAAAEQGQNASGNLDKKNGKTNSDVPKPKRSLSAYNLFFRAERQKLLQVLPDRGVGKKPRNSHGKLGFAAMAKVISSKWNKLTPEEKAPFDELAKIDTLRYKREMAVYKNQACSNGVKSTATSSTTIAVGYGAGGTGSHSNNTSTSSHTSMMSAYSNNTTNSSNASFAQPTANFQQPMQQQQPTQQLPSVHNPFLGNMNGNSNLMGNNNNNTSAENMLMMMMLQQSNNNNGLISNGGGSQAATMNALQLSSTAMSQTGTNAQIGHFQQQPQHQDHASQQQQPNQQLQFQYPQPNQQQQQQQRFF